MRNLKKLVALIVTIVMIATFAIPAFAAAPADVKGTDYEGAVTRLQALGVITGYPNGDFGPNDSITRAQAAAVVVRALGYESIADSAKGVTKFSDVKANYWGAGYINLAVSLNLIKGYGNGKFGPEDKVTYEQVVTMVVRALGAEAYAETKGGFPTGYLLEAKVLKFTDGIKGVSGTNATRGIVAQLVDNAKTIGIFVQQGFGDSQTYTQGTETFLSKLGMSVLAAGKIVTQTPASAGLDANKFVAGGVTYTAVAGTVDVESLLGKKVDLWGSAADKIVLAENVVGTAVAIKTVNDVTQDVSTSVYTVKTTLADGTDKDYTVAAGSAAMKDLQVAGLVAAANDVKGVAADKVQITAVVDGDGNMQFMDAVEFTQSVKLNADPVENKVSKFIRLFGAFYTKYADTAAKKVVIVKDGAIVDWTALKSGDVLFIAGSGDTTPADNYIYVKATNKTVVGTLEAAKGSWAAATSIRVEGTYYDVSTLPSATLLADINTLKGGEVTVSLDPAGKAYSIAGAAVASTNKYGVVLGNQLTPATSISDAVYQVKILTAAGDKITYSVAVNANTTDVTGAANAALANKLAKYTLNADGVVDSITIAPTVTTTSTFDTSRKIFNGVEVSADVVMFYDGAVVKLADIKDDVVNGTTASATFTTDGVIMSMLLTARTLASTVDNYAYVTDFTALTDGIYNIDMVTKDGTKNINTSDAVYGAKGALVKYDINAAGTAITITDPAVANTVNDGTITYADSEKIKFGTTSYWFTDNTLIVYDDGTRDGGSVTKLAKTDLYADMVADVVVGANSEIIAIIVSAM